MISLSTSKTGNHHNLQPNSNLCPNENISQDNRNLPLRMKKSSSNGLFRLFGLGQWIDPKQDSNSSNETSDKPSVAAGLRDMGLEVATCNYIRPSGLKLEPRCEIPAIGHPSSRRAPPPITPIVSPMASPSNSEFNISIKPSSASTHSSKITSARAKFKKRVSQDRILVKDLRDNTHLKVNTNNINNTSHVPLGSPLLSPVTPVHETGLPAFASLKLQFVVGRIAMDFESSSQWTSWLTSYSSGEFNIQNPPAPPPLSQTFSHLPAVYPQNEDSRYSISKTYELAWRNWVQERARLHLRATMKKFSTKFGAMSFFDEEYELLKVENGYNAPRVQRSSSIAAHALYTSEVLSIVDTKEDWRFQNNPMVTGKPRIRFFAATPLITADGVILGVLSIFSKEPREKFSYNQRCQLVECGVALTADIMTQYEYLKISQPSQRLHLEEEDDEYELAESGQASHMTITPTTTTTTTPTTATTNLNQDFFYERDYSKEKNYSFREESTKTTTITTTTTTTSTTPTTTTPTTTTTVYCNPVSGNLSPPSLRYQKLSSFTKPLSKIFTRSNPTGFSLVSSEHTPPSSVESCQGTSLDGPEDNVQSETSSIVYRQENRSRSRSIPSQRRGIPSTQDTCPNRNAPDNNEVITENELEQEDSALTKAYDLSHSKEQPSPTINSGLRDKIIPSFSEDFLCSSPRPFSSSDITSLNSLPPNTPTRSSLQYDLSHHPNLDMTVEDFLSLSDGDLTEQSEDAFPLVINPNQFPHCITHEIDVQDVSTTGSEIAPEGTQNDVSPATPSIHPKTRLPESFLKWKFPKLEAPNSMDSDTKRLSEGDDTQDPDSNYYPNSPSLGKPSSSSSSSLSSSSNFQYETSHEKPHNQQIDEGNSGNLSMSRGREQTNLSLEVHQNLKCGEISAPASPSYDLCYPSEPKYHLETQQRRPSTALSYKSTDIYSRLSNDSINQAAILLASHSRHMGYSLMYIAKIFPRTKDASIISESDITATKPNGIKLQLVTAHGLLDAIHLCPLIHMRVLRSRGPTSWEDFNEKNEFKNGTLVVITAEGGPIISRNRGLILGAFREAHVSHEDLNLPMNKNAETKSLSELAQSLKSILMNSQYSQSPSSPCF